ncbi:ABC1 kinase family protein [Peredibacter starrii]|uniref:Lipopolysaccharide core heptose(II) kinase RfaY n=1 Tax=Peredibacter starrii TaxID=28202 RepID=A0AAX4HQJ6_9BACT|nr:lipopolysaccharide core heptose(II) kinase RfaY [Peredibacter starrii]WPU65579.1 lipopolysaccharide core heptose(II) kinase RfaY [Peredibacter starrii]
MDLIKTSIGISKTIKNVSRFREILNVLSRHGFSELIIKSGLDKVIPGFVLPARVSELRSEDMSNEEWWQVFGEQLRKSFEELGPSFIKLGQLMATREDILDPALIRELKLLQNKVKGIPFETAQKVIEDNLGKRLSDIFLTIDEEAIGTASIGVVYKAQLHNGQKVVVKVRRPGIAKLIHTDFEILLFIVQKLEKVSSEIKFLGMSKMISDFFKSTQNELNFMIEAQNCDRLRKNLELIDKDQYLVVPKVYREFTTEEVLVLEYLDGRPFNEFRSMEELGSDMVVKLEKSIELFTHTLLADGFFHADLHGGNFFVLENRKIGIIDFGLMGTLSKKNRANLISILYAVITYNFDNLVYEFLDVAEYESVPDHEELIRDIKDSISPYIGLSVKETNMTELVRNLIRTLSKHELYLPREWFIIFRALMTLDGVGKSIGMDLNIFKVLEKDLPNLVSELLSRKNAQEELMWVAKDVVTSLRIVPKHLKWFLKEISQNNYSLELRIRDLDKLSKGLNRSLYSLGLSLMACIFILCGAIFVRNVNVLSFYDIPLLTWIFWAFGGYLMIRIAMLRKF